MPICKALKDKFTQKLNSSCYLISLMPVEGQVELAKQQNSFTAFY